MINVAYGLRTTTSGRCAFALSLGDPRLLPLSAVDDIALTLDGASVRGDGIAVWLATRTYAPSSLAGPDDPSWVGADELIVEFAPPERDDLYGLDLADLEIVVRSREAPQAGSEQAPTRELRAAATLRRLRGSGTAGAGPVVERGRRVDVEPRLRP
jgi:hypothetical protein